ncbi:MAG: site-2 protease family protein [Patescibacteria group bacterium]
MPLTIFTIGLLFTIIFHETAHWLAMRRLDIEIEEVGIGYPVKFLPSWKFKIGKFPALVISPLLIGAYVKPTEEGERKLNNLSYKDKASIYGAGVVANLVFAAMITMIIGIFTGHLSKIGYLFIALPIVILFFRDFFCRYIIPLLGAIILFLIPAGLFLGWFQLIGPIETFREAGNMDWLQSLTFLIVISFSLAVMNILPLTPLDGGLIAKELIKKRIGDEYSVKISKISTAFFYCFITFVIISDIIKLFK